MHASVWKIRVILLQIFVWIVDLKVRERLTEYLKKDIKYPFWQMTNTFQHAFYVCLNQGEAYAPAEITRKSVCMNEDIGEVLKEL